MDIWTGHYRLDDDHQPVQIKSMDELKEFYAKPFEETKRVARTQIDGDCHVSTVFLAVDHQFTPGGPPVLFETMIFGGPAGEEDQWRYCTWDEAVAGHERVVKAVLEGVAP
jgi:hypothetical protein